MRSDRKDPSQDDPQFMFNLGALNHLMGHCKKTKLLTLNSPNKEAVKYLPVIKQKKKSVFYYIITAIVQILRCNAKRVSCKCAPGFCSKSQRRGLSGKHTWLQARGGLWELGISKAKHGGVLEREGEASTEGNTW